MGVVCLPASALRPLSPSNRVKTWASWKGYGPGELGEAHEDVLIVAGDISSSLERAAETLTDLKERYDEVRGRRREEGEGDISERDALVSPSELPLQSRLVHRKQGMAWT